MSRHIKSRSGCRVCKAKRLKCDEAVPACRNCINRGITCPGYRQVLRWSTKYEHPTVKANATKGEAMVDFFSASSAAESSSSSNTNGLAQFSELASAVTQSIRPDGLPSSSSSSGSPATMATVSPQPSLAKAEQMASGMPLTQVPPGIQLPHASGYRSNHTHSPPLSANSINPQSPLHTHTPYVHSSLSPYAVRSPSVISTSSSPGPTELAVSREDWHATNLDAGLDLGSIISGDTIGINSDGGHSGMSSGSHDCGNEHSETDGEFALAPWQPERMMDMRIRHHQQQQQRQRRQEQQRQRSLSPSPSRSLTLAGTSLVELWFKSVCGMWAAMDSPTNPFRRLCANLWSSNEAVFFSMQTMAAASLPKRPPNISEIVMLAPQMSTQALINELQDLFTDKGGVQKKEFRFPSGLLTSLFCMSSSLSWIDARQLGIQYLRNARSVIDLVDLRADQLSGDDRELLEFFRGCLLYEEMVRSVVTDDQEDIQALLDWQPPSLNGGGDKQKDKASLSLHAWAGVPIVLVGLFGKVMALCRRSRKRWRHATTSRATYQLLYQSMLDIQEGQSLEQMLLSISIPSLVGGGGGNGSNKGSYVEDDESNENGFLSSPSASPPASPELKSDIYNAAEAFRLLSLLQLYQTFPDLLSQQEVECQQQQQQGQQAVELVDSQTNQPSIEGSDSLYFGSNLGSNLGGNVGGIPGGNLGSSLGSSSGSKPCIDGSGSMMPMALRTVWLLEAIPPDSPMRCLQPLLVICAGSALRLDGDNDGTMPSIGGREHAFMVGDASSASSVSSSVSAILQARAVLSQRLCRLEQNLPPRPITVARQLLDMVWMRYDTDLPPSRSHWLDIMAETEFESVFG